MKVRRAARFEASRTPGHFALYIPERYNNRRRAQDPSTGRAGQHSIRINDQYRVCFRWTAAGVEAVEIVDYH